MKVRVIILIILGVLGTAPIYARLFNRVAIQNTTNYPVTVFTQLPGTAGIITLYTPACVKVGNVCWQKQVLQHGQAYFSILENERMVARFTNDITSNRVFVLKQGITDKRTFKFPEDFSPATINDRGTVSIGGSHVALLSKK